MESVTEELGFKFYLIVINLKLNSYSGYHIGLHNIEFRSVARSKSKKSVRKREKPENPYV